jgi:thiol-disulfide isomerase/thioredoxin
MLFARTLALISALGALMVSSATGVTSNNGLWSKFEKLRQSPRTLHQEFKVTQHIKTAYIEQTTHFEIAVDVAQSLWRERAIGGGGELTRLYDGHDVLTFESEGTEYTRTRQRADKDESLPQPYGTRLDWGKSKELQRLPCGFSSNDHTCVIVDVPIKPSVRLGSPSERTRMTNGATRVMIDTETGIWLQCRTVALIESSMSSYQLDLTYQVKQMNYGTSADAAVFKLPDGLKEVKELTPWNGARIKRQLAGRLAPELQVTDIQGKPISLSELKGKTVLLDFWTTWCPPCQADAPSINKLNQKYGDKNLAIVGISVNEDREIVEKYLSKHPHSYPVVLSSENQMPRPYQVGVFPTYLIISPEGTLMTAEEGDKGFGKLRKELQKAGLETE